MCLVAGPDGAPPHSTPPVWLENTERECQRRKDFEQNMEDSGKILNETGF